MKIHTGAESRGRARSCQAGCGCVIVFLILGQIAHSCGGARRQEIARTPSSAPSTSRPIPTDPPVPTRLPADYFDPKPTWTPPPPPSPPPTVPPSGRGISITRDARGVLVLEGRGNARPREHQEIEPVRRSRPPERTRDAESAVVCDAGPYTWDPDGGRDWQGNPSGRCRNARGGFAKSACCGME